MQEYENKEDLICEIRKRAKLFIKEFSNISEVEKNKTFEGSEKSPFQMLAYQLGWLNLIQTWENLEKKGILVKTPSPKHKWNKLGELYQDFYKEYEIYTLNELIFKFNISVENIIKLVETYTDKELFESGGRLWASSTKSNWAIWKWIHINTVAPFKNFRTKIRKWKKLNNL